MRIWHQQTGRFLSSLVDEELVLFDTEAGDLLSLSGTARLVWDRLEGGVEEQELLAELAGGHDAPPEVIAADVRAFLRQLQMAGLAGVQADPAALPDGRVHGKAPGTDEPA